MYRVGRETRRGMHYKAWWGELLELGQISAFADRCLHHFYRLKNPSTSPDLDEKEG